MAKPAEMTAPTNSKPPETSAPKNSDLVTLCSWSNTVKFEGEWISVEEYLARRFGVVATHSISPDALEKLGGQIENAVALPTAVESENSASRASVRRLAALRATGLLDTQQTRGFDRITRIGAALLGVPATFISLVDEHRDFYLSHCGFSEPLASERQLTGQTFCHFTIQNEEPLVIPDTRADPRYSQVPTVESLGVAAYLGAPLTLLSGETIGAFCATDNVPRQWTAEQIQSAKDMAALVVSEIELRQMVQNLRNTL